MIRPLARLRLQDLTHDQLGALLAAYNRRLTWRYPNGSRTAAWIPQGLDTRIGRGTFTQLETLGLVHRPGNSTEAALTRKGFVLAELAVTLSRQIAAGVIGASPQSFTPVVEEPVALEQCEQGEHVANSAKIPETPALRLNTHPTPRDVIGAQLARAGALEQAERSEAVANSAKKVVA